MRLSVFILIGFSIIGTMLTALGGHTALLSLRELQDIKRAAILGGIETTAMSSTVAMSLERSVTQVALAFEEPIPAGFRSIIEEQRELADSGLQEAVRLANTVDFLAVRDEYAMQTVNSLERVAVLRAEIDQLLALPKSDRDPNRAYMLPVELKSEVVALKNATELLRNRVDASSKVASALQAVQLGAWEVREFGGRARTYFAIATLNQEAISPIDEGLLSIDRSRASAAWASLKNSTISVDELPAGLAADIKAADELYFDEYASVLTELKSTSATQGGIGPTQYAVSFEQFFELSNNALGAMEALSKQGGEQLTAYWNARERSALTVFVGSAIFAVVTLIVLLLIYLQISVRVVGLLGATSRILKSLARGDLDVRVRQNRRELIEIKELHTTVMSFRETMLQARQAETEAKKIAERQKEQDLLLAQKEREENARKADDAARERAEAKARFEKEQRAAQEIATVVAACAAGDFSSRLDMSDKEGVFAEICDGMNKVGEAADKGLGAVREALDRLAEGDLTHRMPEEFSGVFAEIASAMNNTTVSLSTTLTDISLSVSRLDGAAHDISGASSELGERSSANATSLAQSAQELSQVSKLVGTAADAARTAGAAVASVEKMAEDGNKVVAETIDAMTEIKVSSDEIGKVLKLIEDIAFQTNLLALNAGVEAARAGEQGRGFAVVANEVRGLAMRSSKAASEIGELITRSANHVNHGVDLVNASGEALNGVVSGLLDATKKLDDIVSATADTSTSVTEISKATNELDADTKKNMSNFNETEKAVVLIKSVSSDLSRFVRGFRLEAPITETMMYNR